MGVTGAVNRRENAGLTKWEGARMPVIVGGPLAGAGAGWQAGSWVCQAACFAKVSGV